MRSIAMRICVTGEFDLQSQIKWAGRLGLWRSYRQGTRHQIRSCASRCKRGDRPRVLWGQRLGPERRVAGVAGRCAASLRGIGRRRAGQRTRERERTENELSGRRAWGNIPNGSIGFFGDRRCRWLGQHGHLRGISAPREGESPVSILRRPLRNRWYSLGAHRWLTRDQLNESWLRLITNQASRYRN